MAAGADVCLRINHLTAGTRLSRRKWLLFIPPRTSMTSPKNSSGLDCGRRGAEDTHQRLLGGSYCIGVACFGIHCDANRWPVYLGTVIDKPDHGMLAWRSRAITALGLAIVGGSASGPRPDTDIVLGSIIVWITDAIRANPARDRAGLAGNHTNSVTVLGQIAS
jgi:hypothetical protein